MNVIPLCFIASFPCHSVEKREICSHLKMISWKHRLWCKLLVSPFWQRPPGLPTLAVWGHCTFKCLIQIILNIKWKKWWTLECLYGTIALRYYEYCYSILSFRTCNDANQIIYIIETLYIPLQCGKMRNLLYIVHTYH